MEGIVANNIPSEFSNYRHNLPWMNRNLKRLIKKKGRRFKKAKKRKWFFMLLDRIDVSKSSGPDKLHGRLLQCLAKEITPVVHFIFTQSLCTGELPTEWTQAKLPSCIFDMYYM